MSRVEIIIIRLNDTERENRFVEWSVGFLHSMYKVVEEPRRHDYIDVVEVEGGDVFNVYGRYWRKARRMRELLKASVEIWICSGDECIDTTNEFKFKLVMSKYKLRKLTKVMHILEKIVVDKEDKSIWTLYGDGFITLLVDGLSVGKCEVIFYIDEAVALVGLLLLHLYNSTKLKVFKKLYEEVAKMFDKSEIGLNVKVTKWMDEFRVELDTCVMYLTNEELLLLAYKLLNEVMWQLRKSYE
jgi:hypothetical protein